MPSWATPEQVAFLRARLNEYLALTEGKDYQSFWTTVNAKWFAKWPEHAAVFPGVEGPLTKEQEAKVGEAIKNRKKQIQTWYRWRANASHQNRSAKKTASVFDKVLKSKHGRVLSELELFSHEYYDERIKPVIEAEKEAGNISSRGEALNVGRRLSKELLNAVEEEVKAKIKTMYSLQKKKDKDKQTLDPATIQQAIDELPVALAEIGALIKCCTGFAVSFVCPRPDPSKNWKITSIFCHPDVTPQGNTFSHLYPKENNDMVTAFHDFAEVLFPIDQRNPATGIRVSDPRPSADGKLESANKIHIQAVEGHDKGENEVVAPEDVSTGVTFVGDDGHAGENSQDDSEMVERTEEAHTSVHHNNTVNASHSEGDASFDFSNLSYTSFAPGSASFDLGSDMSFTSFGLGDALYFQTQATMANTSLDLTGPSPIGTLSHINPTGFAPGPHPMSTLLFDPFNGYIVPDVPFGSTPSAAPGSNTAGFGNSLGTVSIQAQIPQWNFSMVTGISIGLLLVCNESLAPGLPTANRQLSANDGHEVDEVRLPAPLTCSESPINSRPSATPMPTSTDTISKPRPCPKVIKRNNAVQNVSLQELQPNPTTPSPADVSPTCPSTDVPPETSDSTGQRAKRIPKKSTRNKTANAIGTNRTSFVERGRFDKHEVTQKPASWRGKRTSNDTQGKATKKPKAK